MGLLKKQLLDGFWNVRFVDSLPEDWEERIVSLIHEVADNAERDFPRFKMLNNDPVSYSELIDEAGNLAQWGKAVVAWYRKWLRVSTKK